MRAADAGRDVPYRPGLGGDDVHVDAEPVAEHAARVANAAIAVDRVAERDEVNHLAPVGGELRAALGEGTADVDVLDLVAAESHPALPAVRCGLAAGDVDHDLALRPADHLPGGLDGVGNGRLGLTPAPDDAIA